MEVDPGSINIGFSKQAARFDEEDFSNPILQWMRGRVRKHTENFLKPGNTILELNAGTGLDALYFAQRGYNVYATDLSDGMIAEIEKKILQNKMQDSISFQQLSYTQLDKVKEGPFDLIFSNFGGVNCIPCISDVSKNIPKVLKPGGYITLVIMPPICPWELALVLKGNFRKAFRRLQRNGDMAHLEGEHFMTYYFTPGNVRRAFGKEYKQVALEALGTFTPPPHKKEFARKHPTIFKALTAFDNALCRLFPFNHWADHYIITLQYCPALQA